MTKTDDSMKKILRKYFDKKDQMNEGSNYTWEDCDREATQALTKREQRVKIKAAIEELHKLGATASGGGDWRRVLELRIGTLTAELEELANE